MSADLEFSIRRRLGSGFELNAEATLPMPGGSFTVMLGSSGSGKTTILRALAGLDHPDRGRIRMADTVWFDDERGIRLPPQRRGAGLVPQEGAVFPHLDVEANVGFGITGLAPSARRERIRSMLRLTRLDGLDRRRPDQLSGGQRQRVALARSLAVNPKLLLLDEPFTALDVAGREMLAQILAEERARGAAILLTSHDLETVAEVSDAAVLLVDGRIVERVTRATDHSTAAFATAVRGLGATGRPRGAEQAS
jgi:iron(III) transport system ATP-binding protein